MLLVVCVKKCEFAGAARGGEIDDTLVARSAKVQREIAQLFAVVAVNEDVQLFEQRVHVRVALCAEFFESKPRVAPHIEPTCVCGACEREQCPRLKERFAAAERQPREERVFIQLRDHGADGCRASADERLCLRIVTSGAPPRTALCKDRQADALAVDNGVAGDAGDADLSGVRA